MRILHIITGLKTGGAESALCALLAGGLADLFHCEVLSLADGGTIGVKIQSIGVPVHELGIESVIAGPAALLRLRHHVERLQPDIIQGWMYHGNLVASISSRLFSGRSALAWNVRQSLYDLNNEKLLTRQVIRASRVISSCPHVIIYNSQLSRAQHERFGFTGSSGIIILNGFDLSLFRPNHGVGLAIRRENGLDPDALVVGHFARFHPIKDHSSFLRAAVEVARRLPRARFLLVGREVGPENSSLAGIVPDELRQRFIFTGERPDVLQLMQAIDVLCLSSVGEAFPNVLGEAMACGVPCVTTDVGDSAYIVGETGIVVPPSNSPALAGALIKMLEKQPHALRELGKRARQRIAANFGIDAMVDRYAEMYEKIAGDAISR